MRSIITILMILSNILVNAYGKPINSNNMSYSCNVNFEGTSFGNYNPLNREQKVVPFWLVVKCMGSGIVKYEVRLINNSERRYLTSQKTKNKLYYSLILPDKCPFGDGTNGTCTIKDKIYLKNNLHVVEKRYKIIGIIFPNQDIIPSFDYNDHLTIEIDY